MTALGLKKSQTGNEIASAEHNNDVLIKGLLFELISMGTILSLYAETIIIHLGVQQCFGVVYHELTTLRRVYFAK